MSVNGCVATRTRDGATCFFFSDKAAYREACTELVNEEGASYGLPGTDGGLWSNLIAFVRNNHPVASMCLQHECHAFRPWKRALVLFTMNCWAFFVAACFALRKHRMHWYKESLAVTILTLPYETFLEALATGEWGGHKPRLACQCCGSIFLVLLAASSMLWLSIGLIIGRVAQAGFALSYGNSIWQEWLLWAAWNLPFFVYKHLAACKRFSEHYPKGVVSIEYAPEAPAMHMDKTHTNNTMTATGGGATLPLHAVGLQMT